MEQQGNNNTTKAGFGKPGLKGKLTLCKTP